MDEDKKLEDILEREAMIESDSNMPLHQIRQKEMELSGLVLKAREEASEIVSKARKQAADVLSKAETDAEAEARAYEASRLDEGRAEAETVRHEVEGTIKAVDASVADRHEAAVKAVVERVTRV